MGTRKRVRDREPRPAVVLGERRCGRLLRGALCWREVEARHWTGFCATCAKEVIGD